MSLLKSSAIIGSFTMCSRVLGFTRDVLIANLIGASWLSDAFFVAFKLPNFFRRLFAEGAFNAAFVPQFAGLLAAEDAKTALRFAGQVFSLLLLALLALNALFLTFMPWWLQWFAPGFVDTPEKYELTVELARICFPYILFISLVSLLSGILNSSGKFAAVAATPILLNISLIGAMYLLPAHTDTVAHALSWGVFAAGVLQLIWLFAFAWRNQCIPTLVRPRLTPPIRRFFKLIAPAALGAGVAQVNLLIDVVLASLFPEGVSYLYYADRLNELPIGVIGVAVGTALLPMLSKQYKLHEHDKAIFSLNRAMELVLLFAFPATIALITIPQLLITVLYQHGAFTMDDVDATYRALTAYAFGLPAFVLVKVLAPGFFANEDTKTPFKIALVCVITNFTFNIILMQWFEHVGLAMATSIAGWLNAGLMAVILYRRRLLRPDALLSKRLLRFLLSALIMGGLLLLLQELLSPLLTQIETPPQALGLAIIVTSAIIGYGGLIVISGAIKPSELKRYLRQQ